MKRVMTAMGRASGRVTKKKDVSRIGQQYLSLHAVAETHQVIHQRVLFLFLGEGKQFAQGPGFFAALEHLVDPQRVDLGHAQQAAGVGGRGGVEDVTSYSSSNIRSTMFSNIADSSKAGFIVADSTNSSALVEISANFRNHWIFSRILCLERSMVSLVSIS